MKYTIRITRTYIIDVEADYVSEAIDKFNDNNMTSTPVCDVYFDHNPDEHVRVCSTTGRLMYEGWVANDGDEYFSNEQDAINWAHNNGYESLQDAYDDEAIYWTQWHY